MAYSVNFTPRALCQYTRIVRQLTASERRRLDSAIDGLANEPRPVGCEKLSGHTDRYRVRVGDYRVVYEINDAELFVLVVIIAPMRDDDDLLRRS